MLLDCAKLGHWQCERQFEEMFSLERDYIDWIRLRSGICVAGRFHESGLIRIQLKHTSVNAVVRHALADRFQEFFV